MPTLFAVEAAQKHDSRVDRRRHEVMMLQERIISSRGIDDVIRKCDERISSGEYDDVFLDWIVERLKVEPTGLIYIAERIARIGKTLEARVSRLLLVSLDDELVTVCAFILLTFGNLAGITSLLRAVANGHELQIVLARRLAARRVQGTIDAISIALENGTDIKFDRFIELIDILSGLAPSEARMLLDIRIKQATPIEVRFHSDVIRRVQEAGA